MTYQRKFALAETVTDIRNGRTGIVGWNVDPYSYYVVWVNGEAGDVVHESDLRAARGPYDPDFLGRNPETYPDVEDYVYIPLKFGEKHVNLHIDAARDTGDEKFPPMVWLSLLEWDGGPVRRGLRGEFPLSIPMENVYELAEQLIELYEQYTDEDKEDDSDEE